MTIREKIEAVLRKHGIIPGLEITKFGASSITDDLLSCFPQPSREKLDSIFRARFASAIDHPRNTWTLQGIWEAIEVAKIDIMSWATGNQEQAEWLKVIQFDILRWKNGNWSEPKVWCSHLIWDQSGWSTHDINKGIITRWITWQFCPICGVPKPSE